ncbi:MAG: hypothetical protein RSP_17490 [Rhodanobacter sp.]
MSTATRIDEETVDQVNRHSSRMTRLQVDLMHQRQRSQESTQGARRRAVQRENDDLEDECVRLRAALAEAEELIDFWANGSEAFRRTLRHLHESWTPPAGTETDLNTMVNTHHADARQDPAWIEKRDATTKQQRERIRNRQTPR